MTTDISAFQSLDLTQAKNELHQLHECVVRHHRRIEITAGAHGASVLISKAELDSLERALEILSETEDVRTLCQKLSALAGMATADSAAA